MYHIEDLKKFMRCPRYYFQSRNDNPSFKHYLRSDESTIDLLVKHLHIDNYFRGVAGDNNDRFIKERGNYQWLVKTRFQIDNLRIRIPIMHKVNDAYDIYFMYNGTSVKDLDLFYYRIVIEVLRILDIDINNVYLAYINSEYVFHDSLNVDELFIITDYYKGKKLIDIFEEEILDFKEIISRIESTRLDSYMPKKTRTCHLRNMCPYYFNCFKEEENLPNDSILTLVSSQYKDQMYKAGIKHLKDVDLNLLEGNRLQYSQILASKNGGEYVCKYGLRKWLERLDNRPISFIDFEWDTYLVPQYEGMKPLNVLPFEFVLYVLDEKGELNHYSFLGKGDSRREFAEGLIKYIPKTGPIVAYNAYGAECKRIEELADYFPELKEDLLKIKERFVDLAYPFIEGLLYDTRMQGDFSLKKLVSIVSDYNYKELDINDGMAAVYNWRDIDKGDKDINDKKVMEDLIEYCSLDAYGLYLVYTWLLEQI